MLEFDQKRKYEELPVLSSLLIVLCCLLSKASKEIKSACFEQKEIRT